VGNPEGKRPLGIPRHRWVDKIMMDFQEGCKDWIEMSQDRDRAGTCEHGNEHNMWGIS
jgi:hypothetical protein